MHRHIFFPWYGSKYRMIPEVNALIIEACKAIINESKQISEPHVYSLSEFKDIILVDCFGGSGVITINRPVLIQKAILNEKNTEIVVLHELMANPDKQDELIKRLTSLKYGKTQFEEAKQYRATGFIGMDKMQIAEYMYTLITQSFNACMENWHFESYEGEGKQGEYTKRIRKRLSDAQKRYKGVTVMNIDAFDLVKRYKNNSNACLILDPPYLLKLRKAKSVYGKGKYELSLKQHKRLLSLIKEAKCKIILFGYWSNLYDNKLGHTKGSEWWSFELKDVAKSCQLTKGGMQKGRGIEWVWTNFEPSGLARYTINGLKKHYQITKKS